MIKLYIINKEIIIIFTYIIFKNQIEMSSKSILNKKSMQFLEKYLNNASPTGYEWEGQKIWMDYLKPYADEFITDTYGSAVAVINPDHEYKVVIEGHSDEISWYVNYISDKGLISVIRNGGSDHQIAPSKIVNIHTEKGIVKGVFGWPAIHTRLAIKEEPPKLDNIFIDVGCKNKKDVEKLGVHVGCVITYPDPFHILNKDNFVCRALDNRIGGFMIAEVTSAALMSENKHLANPCVTDSTPTSANQEDHVSMAAHGAYRLFKMNRNLSSIFGIELLCAAQGIDARDPLKTSSVLQKVISSLRQHIPRLKDDRYMATDINKVTNMIEDKYIIKEAELNIPFSAFLNS